MKSHASKTRLVADPRVREAAEKVIEAAASRREILEACGVTSSAVSQWKRFGIPAEYMLRLSKLTGINADEIRPDTAPISVAVSDQTSAA